MNSHIPKKILLVDDEEAILSLLSKILEGKGHNILISSNGKNGIEIAKKEKPDLIILDVKLPDISGMEVLENIKKISADSIVIMMSGDGTQETKKELKRKGAYCFIDKPFTYQKILSVIKRFTG